MANCKGLKKIDDSAMRRIYNKTPRMSTPIIRAAHAIVVAVRRDNGGLLDLSLIFSDKRTSTQIRYLQEACRVAQMLAPDLIDFEARQFVRLTAGEDFHHLKFKQKAGTFGYQLKQRIITAMTHKEDKTVYLKGLDLPEEEKLLKSFAAMLRSVGITTAPHAVPRDSRYSSAEERKAAETEQNEQLKQRDVVIDSEHDIIREDRVRPLSGLCNNTAASEQAAPSAQPLPLARILITNCAKAAGRVVYNGFKEIVKATVGSW